MNHKYSRIIIWVIVLNIVVLTIYIVNVNQKKKFNIPENLVNVNIEGADSLSIYSDIPKVIFYLDFDCSKCFMSIHNIDSLYYRLLENGIELFIVAGCAKLENVKVLLNYNDLNHLKVYYDKRRELLTMNKIPSVSSLFTLLSEDNTILYQGNSYTSNSESENEFNEVLEDFLKED